jgi:hypothetical protein
MRKYAAMITEWLLAHDVAVQGVAAGTLLVFAGLSYWWSRDRPSLHELGTMSTKWLTDRHLWRKDHWP